MSEKKTIYKWFWVWEFDKEEAWLNEMSMNGWALCRVGLCRYEFERSAPSEYIIRLEYRRHDENYFQFMQELGAEYIGHYTNWRYFRKNSSEGSFDLFSDIDSKINHLNQIGRLIAIIGGCNLVIGFVNSINVSHAGWINLLCATLLMYGLGRIHGMKEALEKDRLLQE